MAVPALIIENRGIGSALGRSLGLVRGTFWRVWGTRALVYLIAALIGGAIGAVFSFVALQISGVQSSSSLLLNDRATGSLPTSYLVILAIGSAISFMVTAPLKAAVDSLLYVDLRMRKENLAVDLQRAAAQLRGGSPSG